MTPSDILSNNTDESNISGDSGYIPSISDSAVNQSRAVNSSTNTNLNNTNITKNRNININTYANTNNTNTTSHVSGTNSINITAAPLTSSTNAVSHNQVGSITSTKNSLAVPQSSFATNASIASIGGGEQFVIWQMQSRKLRHMKHEELMEWLEKNSFDQETIKHFKLRKIDGRILWNNIRNASMFLYNVGVVRPTLRDAIVQNIYLNLMPKTPGFDERFIKDFRNFKMIASGPLSTVYEAVYTKGKLKLRDSRLVIKGYHYKKTDDIRIGKIIQVLTHITAKLNKIQTPSRFVSVYGFIRDMNVSNVGNKRNSPKLDSKTDDNGQNRKTVKSPKSGKVRFKEDFEENDNDFKEEEMKLNISELHQKSNSIFGIVMEFADLHSIRTQFNRNWDYTLIEKFGILLEIAEAMSELHDANLLHKNLKANNIVIAGDDVKLTDYCFDITSIADFTGISEYVNERSIRWMSPELITFQQYSKKSDVYAFGITMYEILTQNLPFYEFQNLHELVPKVCLPCLFDFLLACLCWVVCLGSDCFVLFLLCLFGFFFVETEW